MLRAVIIITVVLGTFATPVLAPDLLESGCVSAIGDFDPTGPAPRYATMPAQRLPSGFTVLRGQRGETLGYESDLPQGHETEVQRLVVEALGRLAGLPETAVQVVPDRNGGPSKLVALLGEVKNPTEAQHIIYHAHQLTLRRFQQYLETGGRRIQEIMLGSDNPDYVAHLTRELTPEDLMVLNQAHINAEAHGHKLTLKEIACP